MPGDIILLHMCIINEDHIMYGSWDIRHLDIRDISSFWAIFCPLTLLTTRKIKILKKWKKTLEDIILHKSNINHDHMLYCSWNIVRDGCHLYFSFWAIFCNFEKMKKMPGYTITLHMLTKNHDHIMYSSWNMARDGRMDRWTDGRKKWHIEVVAPPKEHKTYTQKTTQTNQSKT